MPARRATNSSTGAVRRTGPTQHNLAPQTNWGEARPKRPERANSTDNSLGAMRRCATRLRGEPGNDRRHGIDWFGRDSKNPRQPCAMIAARFGVQS